MTSEHDLDGEPLDPNPVYRDWGPHPHGPPQALPPPPPYGHGLPGQATRPSQVLAASGLAFVLGALLVLSGLLLLVGAAWVHDLGAVFGAGTGGVTTELSLDGVADLTAAGLLVGGGLAFLGRSRRGRTVLLAGACLTLVECVYWLARTSGDGTAAVLVLCYGAPSVVALSLSIGRRADGWLPPGHARPSRWQGGEPVTRR